MKPLSELSSACWLNRCLRPTNRRGRNHEILGACFPPSRPHANVSSGDGSAPAGLTRPMASTALATDVIMPVAEPFFLIAQRALDKLSLVSTHRQRTPRLSLDHWQIEETTWRKPPDTCPMASRQREFDPTCQRGSGACLCKRLCPFRSHCR